MTKKKVDAIVAPLQYVAPLTDDLLRLRDEISQTLQTKWPKGWKKNSDFFKALSKSGQSRPLLWDPTKSGLDLHPGIEILIIGSFRANVWMGFQKDGELLEPRYVGWVYEPIKLWHDRYVDLLDKLRSIFEQLAKKSGHAFVRLPLASDVQIPNWGEGERQPPPEIIYDVLTRRKYIVDAAKGSFHWNGEAIVGGAADEKHGYSYRLVS